MSSTNPIHYVLNRLRSERSGSPEVQEQLVSFLVSESENNGRQSIELTVDLRVGALLRLLEFDEQIIYQSKNRPQALRLIESRFRQQCESLLERYGLTGKAQADEQCRNLASLVPDADRELRKALDDYKGVESLGRFRQGLLRSLNSDLAKPSIQPFLPDSIEQIRECLSLAVEYSNSEAGDAARIKEDATASIEKLLGPTTDQPNEVFAPLADVLARIRDDLEKDFKASPYSKPATLILDASVRRHPLHLDQHELAIPLVLSNVGDGVALDVEVMMIEGIGLKPGNAPTRVQRIGPGTMVIEVRATTEPGAISIGEVALGVFDVSWSNADSSVGSQKFDLYITPQDASVDWESLQRNNPYSLEPVRSEADLIGRGDVLKRIAATLNTVNVGSLYIHGQKRVGKTSLARVALEQLQTLAADLTPIYEDIGGYPSDASGATNTLVRNLVQQIDDRIGIPQSVRQFEYDGSLSPLISILKSLSRAKKRIIIALDEFDRLPVVLFRRSGGGDSFFTGLRSISNIEGVGVVLIAGERMKIIVNAGGVELNLFQPFPIDYLDRRTQWPEFEELVRQPSEGYLEFTDDACTKIYEYTAGNPYYTKLLCGQILQQAAKRRDAFIDAREVEVAVELLLGQIDPTSFAHYWEDFMLEQDEKRDEITLRRRRCLRAIGRAQTPGSPVLIDDVISASTEFELDSINARQMVDEFVSRDLYSRNGDFITARVRLFERWLKERGQQQIVLAGAELESVSQLSARRESLRVTFDEAERLAKSWGPYQGRAIHEERLLSYLKQFETLEDQRLIFKILREVKFIDDAAINDMFRSAWLQITDSLKAADGEWNRDQIRLSYFGGLGKSSLNMARTFASVNGIMRNHRGIESPEKLHFLIKSGLKDVIFVDDFVGSGDTICDALIQLQEQIPDGVRVHFVVLAGVAEGFDRVDTALHESFGDLASFHPMYTVRDGLSIFSPDSGVFDSAEEGAGALALVKRWGDLLESRIPLGYGDACSLIAFAHNIPNNAPPILRRSSTGKVIFEALFPRS